MSLFVRYFGSISRFKRFVQSWKKVKKQALSISFFSYFTWGISFVAKISGFTNT